MTVANGILDFSAASNLMVQSYMKNPNPQENQWAPTIKHIKRHIPFGGIDQTGYVAAGGEGTGTSPHLSAMRIQMGPTILANSQGNRSIDAAMPAAQTFDGRWVDVSQNHLSRVAGTMTMTATAMEHVKGEDAVVNAAMMLRTQNDRSLAEREEQMINGPSSGIKGTITGVYVPSTGNASSGAVSYMFLKLSTSPMMFHVGEQVYVTYGAGAVTNVCPVATVQAVCPDPVWNGWSIGPGIIVKFSATTNTTSVTAGDSVYPATEDGSTGGFIMSIPALFDRTVTFFNTIRTAVDAYLINDYLNPEQYVAGTSSVNTAFDIDTHFGRMFNTLGSIIGDSDNRMEPLFGEDAVKMSKAIITEAGPALVREIIRQANQPRARFTRAMPGTLGEAEKSIWASAGASGVVIQDPGLPPIVVQQNNLMAPNAIRTWDPQQVGMIEMNGGQPYWCKAPGAASVWNQMQYASGDAGTNTLIPVFSAACFKIRTPFWFKPKANYQIQYLKDSIGSIA